MTEGTLRFLVNRERAEYARSVLKRHRHAQFRVVRVLHFWRHFTVHGSPKVLQQVVGDLSTVGIRVGRG